VNFRLFASMNCPCSGMSEDTKFFKYKNSQKIDDLQCGSQLPIIWTIQFIPTMYSQVEKYPMKKRVNYILVLNILHGSKSTKYKCNGSKKSNAPHTNPFLIFFGDKRLRDVLQGRRVDTFCMRIIHLERHLPDYITI
jgi:hypothetical protein